MKGRQGVHAIPFVIFVVALLLSPAARAQSGSARIAGD